MRYFVKNVEMILHKKKGLKYSNPFQFLIYRYYGNKIPAIT